ncbi:pyridoxamine 5'-phosphate oxidase family protein [Candidatus Bipolaricaulota bacterium]|nr:pyridoxamine 5'-phosphate oxidase family protein [Candidatus Bipolaricaulota bacterium]
MIFVDRLLLTLRQEEDFLCALATVGIDGLPYVRYMKGVIDEHLIIRCPTFASTQKVQQIRDCADVSLTCGDTDSSQPGSYFQIAAKGTISRDPADKVAAWTSRLEKWFSGVEDPTYLIVKIEPVRIIACPIGGGPAVEIWER